MQESSRDSLDFPSNSWAGDMLENVQPIFEPQKNDSLENIDLSYASDLLPRSFDEISDEALNHLPEDIRKVFFYILKY